MARRRGVRTLHRIVPLVALALLAGCREVPPDGSVGGVLADEPFGIELVYIPGGDLEWEADETRHAMTVHLQPFYVGRYEVTQEQWKAVMGAYPYVLDPDSLPIEFRVEGVLSERAWELATGDVLLGDSLPAERLSWDAAELFVQRLSEATGHRYRLPTTAEWEYACRAGTTTDYYFGNDTLMLAAYEWYDENAEGVPHPVGRKQPNPWGLYDIAGNVAEWTATIADMAPYERLYPDRDFGPGVSRAYRGSHYLHTKAAAQCGYGHTYWQVMPRRSVGLRVVRDP